MAKSSRFKHSYRSNASKLHKSVGEAIRSHPLLKHYKSYQEYPVSRVNPTYRNNSHKFDWVIIDLKVVIEAHGQQHYEPVCFGGISKEEAAKRYYEQVERDLEKRRAAEDAGWTYIAVKYDDTLDVERLADIAIANSAPLQRKTKKSWMTEDQKERARKRRKENYQRQKNYFKKLNHDKENSSE